MKDKILELIRNRGPMHPSELSKQLKINTMFVGAHLSEMIANGKLEISSLKVGSSPVYYLKGQRARLEVFYKYLNDKDKNAFDILKKWKVLRDKNLEPIIRVSLRNIKDFAIPLNVSANGEKEIFWKWHLVDDKEAEPIIRKQLEGKRAEEEKIRISLEEKKKEETEQLKKNQEIEKKKSEDTQNKLDEEMKIIEEQKKKLEEERKIMEKERDILKEERKSMEKEKITKQLKKEEQKTLKEEIKREEPRLDEVDDPFLIKIKEYCTQNHMEITNFKIIKKKLDIELIIKIPTPVGEVTYFCKAKNKKKINDGDLNSALVKGQLKKLPALLLGMGDLTKKAQQELEGELKDYIKFKKI